MRTTLTLLVALMALPAAANGGFSLDLVEMDFSNEATLEPSRDIVPLATDEIPPDRDEVLAFQAALKPRTPAERTEALWSSDMGRLYYELAVQQSMLGREGLVNGGRMAGVGLATAGIGDGDPNGALGMALGRGRWVEMNANQRFQAGIEAGILGALIAFMVSNAN
jgi:hypothetical protein